MGSEESKPNKPVQPTGEGCPTTINHDSFRNFKYIKGHEGDDNIEIRVPIENEEEYRKWESHLKDCPTEHEFYLMPLQIHLKNEGFCGNTHFLEVDFPLFRFCMRIFPTFCSMKSPIGQHSKGKNLNSNSPNCGTSCTCQWRLFGIST